MSLADFFDGHCDIYHVVETTASPGYNLPGSPSFSYPAQPDESNIPCHFHVRAQNINITQTEPANRLTVDQKLSLPADTDIRLNDKVVDRDTGLEYTAKLPRNIRGHHKITNLKRTQQQEPL